MELLRLRSFIRALALCVVLVALANISAARADSTAVPLAAYATSSPQGFFQDWSDTGLISTANDWSGVAAIMGYSGSGLTTVVDKDPQIILANDTTLALHVLANATNPNTLTTGGTAEFQITDPVVALQGSSGAPAPYLKIALDATGVNTVRIEYDVRDIDGSADNSVQQVALQYRIGASGSFTNLPGGYIADATEGPSLASKVTHVDVTLPSAADNQANVELRIMTVNATGNDEWVGIDNILVTANYPPTGFTLTSNSVLENQAAGTLVGTLVAEDPNSSDAHTFALVDSPDCASGSADNAYFSLTGNDLSTAATFDYEAQTSYVVCVEVADNNGLAAAFNQTLVVLDIAEDPALTVTLEQSAAQNDPTPASPINFTATFSAPIDVSTFSASDVTLSGTAGADSIYITEIAPNDGTTFNLAVSGMNAAGTVIASIGAGSVKAATTSWNEASVSTDNTVEYLDAFPSVVSIVRANANPSNMAYVVFVATFSEHVADVDAGDFEVITNGVSGASIYRVSGYGQTYSITVNAGTGTGTLGLNLADNDSITDIHGNALVGAETENGDFTGEVYDLTNIEQDPPKVVSVTRLDSSPTNAEFARFAASFSEPVTGVDATDFRVAATGGITGAAITEISGSGTDYVVTVNSGTGNGSLRLNVYDNDTIIDAAGNPLGGMGRNNASYYAGQFYALDKTPPTLVTLARIYPNPANSAIVKFAATFSESVTGVELGDFTLAASGVTDAALVNISGYGAKYAITVNAGTGNGTLGLNLADDDTITDAVGNPLGGSGDENLEGEVYDVVNAEQIPPKVVSAVRVDVSPTNADFARYAVTFSEPVTGVDTTDFYVNNSILTEAFISAVSGSNTDYLVTVSIGAGTGTLYLVVRDNDSIIDLAGNPLGGVGRSNGYFRTTQPYAVDNVSPTMISLTRDSASPTNSATVKYAATFSEPVTGVDAGDFNLVAEGVADASLINVSGYGTKYAITVNAGTGSGTLGLDLIDDDSITDVLGNPLVGTVDNNGNYTGEVFELDNVVQVPPTVVSILRADPSPANANSVNYVATFSEIVTGVDATDFYLYGSAATGSVISEVNGSGTTYNIKVDTSGSGMLRLNLSDDDTILDESGLPLGGAGNGNGAYVAGQYYNVDKTPPSVVSIVRAMPNPTNATNVLYAVTFSESVRNVTPEDFVTTGMLSAAVVKIKGQGNTYTVRVSTETGSGTLGLNLSDDDSITDIAGNPLGGINSGNGSKDGEVYDVVDAEQIPPRVLSITRSGSSPTNADSISFTVTFSEWVDGVDVEDFAPVALWGNSAAGASIAEVSGTGSSYVVTVNTGNNGSMLLRVKDNDSIRDAAGNPLGGRGFGNGAFTATATQAYVIDKTAPTLLSLARISPNPSGAAIVKYAAEFSENVTGIDPSDFYVFESGINGSTLASVTGRGKTYTIAVKTGVGNGTLSLHLADDDSIKDAIGNPLGGAGNEDHAGEIYDMLNAEQIPPTVLAITRADANPTSAELLHFTVTFSEAVTGVDINDFGYSALGIPNTLTGITVVEASGSEATYLVTVQVGAGEGNLRLNVIDNDTIIDAAGNRLGGAGRGNGAFYSGQYYMIEP